MRGGRLSLSQAYSPPMPKSRVVRALGAKSAKILHVQYFGTQHPANAKTHKTVRERPGPKIVMSSAAQWIGSEASWRLSGSSPSRPKRVLGGFKAW